MILGRLFTAVRTSFLHRTIATSAFRVPVIKVHVPRLYLCQKCFHRSIFTQRKKQNTATPVFLQAEQFGDKVAVVDQNGCFSYNDLLHHSKLLSDNLIKLMKQASGGENLDWSRVAFLCENDVSYVVAQWAIWMARGVAVPLCKSHPVSELEYVIDNAQCSIVVTTSQYTSTVEPIVKKLDLLLMVLEIEDYAGYYDADQNAWNNLMEKHCRDNISYSAMQNYFKNKPCLIIYTSGTTGRPKGVVLTYGNLQSNITGMIEEWGWTSNDVILHVLPLHHVHGVVNTLMVPLYCGATVVMLPKFDPTQVWEKLVARSETALDINVFMAVPTIYSKLIENIEEDRSHGKIASLYIKSTCSEKIRLMVSGSAALPMTVMDKWNELTGHTLLERYGMTELGMVLTNPLEGQRIPGAVGNPFPGVQVAIGKPDIQNHNKYNIIATGNSTRTTVSKGMQKEQGELLVKGPTVFKEYWNNPEATSESFAKDGWFKTGDTAIYSNGVYRILGRTSVDIIKSGGYKVSALEIERRLLEHPDIAECAVVGLPDITWGQKVAAVIVTKSKECLDLHELKAWCSDKLSSYQTPTVLKNVSELPRNAMGKINKKDLVKTIFPSHTNRSM